MGKDTVNPIGAMLSAATLLAHLGLVEEATKLRVAIRLALSRDRVAPAEVAHRYRRGQMRAVGTRDFCRAVQDGLL